jgi:hypothetical protein
LTLTYKKIVAQTVALVCTTNVSMFHMPQQKRKRKIAHTFQPDVGLQYYLDNLLKAMQETKRI